MKTKLTEREFMEIKDLVCEGCLDRDAEHKQYYLLEIGGIITGSKKEFINSAIDQGYNISKGVKP